MGDLVSLFVKETVQTGIIHADAGDCKNEKRYLLIRIIGRQYDWYHLTFFGSTITACLALEH